MFLRRKGIQSSSEKKFRNNLTSCMPCLEFGHSTTYIIYLIIDCYDLEKRPIEQMYDTIFITAYWNYAKETFADCCLIISGMSFYSFRYLHSAVFVDECYITKQSSSEKKPSARKPLLLLNVVILRILACSRLNCLTLLYVCTQLAISVFWIDQAQKRSCQTHTNNPGTYPTDHCTI